MAYATRNDLPDNARKAMIALLNARLADAIDLRLAVKQAHWNVKGPNFVPLHELFDRVNTEALAWSDELAERAVQLGGVAEGTLERIVKHTALPAHSLELVLGRDHLAAMAESLAVFAQSVRAAIDAAARAGDAGTADLFTEISRGADKTLWMLEAHLQAER